MAENNKICTPEWVIGRIEKPTHIIRWLKKKNGEKVLQQMWYIQENHISEVEWRDVEEVEEE